MLFRGARSTREQLFQRLNQLWWIVVNHRPANVEIDCKVTMDQSIAHGDDFVPGNLRRRFPGGFRKTAGRFSNHLDETL